MDNFLKRTNSAFNYVDNNSDMKSAMDNLLAFQLQEDTNLEMVLVQSLFEYQPKQKENLSLNAILAQSLIEHEEFTQNQYWKDITLAQFLSEI